VNKDHNGQDHRQLLRVDGKVKMKEVLVWKGAPSALPAPAARRPQVSSTRGQAVKKWQTSSTGASQWRQAGKLAN
jgi:hypothetical protein